MTEKAKDKQRGTNHHSWNGGRYVRQDGYVSALAKGHPYAKDDYVYEHRLVVEKYLRKHNPKHPALRKNGFLKKSWAVHHKNGNRGDNSISNLEPMPRSQHSSWIHYLDELKRLRALLDKHGISY